MLIHANPSLIYKANHPSCGGLVKRGMKMTLWVVAFCLAWTSSHLAEIEMGDKSKNSIFHRIHKRKKKHKEKTWNYLLTECSTPTKILQLFCWFRNNSSILPLFRLLPFTSYFILVFIVALDSLNRARVHALNAMCIKIQSTQCFFPNLEEYT